MSNRTTVAILRCIDKRHWGKLAPALDAHTGGGYDVYDLSIPGGAGIWADLLREPGLGAINESMGIAVNDLGATEIWLAVHGIEIEGHNGCGAYKLAGHGAHYATPEQSKTFSTSQLKIAASRASEAFPAIKTIRTFYITFGEQDENLIHEVM